MNNLHIANSSHIAIPAPTIKSVAISAAILLSLSAVAANPILNNKAKINSGFDIGDIFRLCLVRRLNSIKLYFFILFNLFSNININTITHLYLYDCKTTLLIYNIHCKKTKKTMIKYPMKTYYNKSIHWMKHYQT